MLANEVKIAGETVPSNGLAWLVYMMRTRPLQVTFRLQSRAKAKW